MLIRLSRAGEALPQRPSDSSRRPAATCRRQAPRRETLPRIPFSDWYVAPSARTAAARALATGWVANGPEVSLIRDRVRAPRGSALRRSGLFRDDRPGAGPGGPAAATRLTRAGLHPELVRRRPGHRPGRSPAVLVDVSVDHGHAVADHRQRGSDSREAGRRPAEALVLAHQAGDPADVAALADAAGFPRPWWSRTPHRASAAAWAIDHVGGAGHCVLQLLRDHEPARRRGRHGHDRRPGTCRAIRRPAARPACPAPDVAGTTAPSRDPASVTAVSTPP